MWVEIYHKTEPPKFINMDRVHLFGRVWNIPNVVRFEIPDNGVESAIVIAFDSPEAAIRAVFNIANAIEGGKRLITIDANNGEVID